MNIFTKQPEKVIKSITLVPENGEDILTGKEEGALAREKHALEDLDKELETSDGVVEVRISPSIMTSSFAIGMFSQSIRKFGADGFHKKYKIYGSGFALTIVDAIVRHIVRYDMPLAQ